MMFSFLFKTELEKISEILEKSFDKLLSLYGFSHSNTDSTSNIYSIIIFKRNEDFIKIIFEDMKTCNMMSGEWDARQNDWGLNVWIGQGNYDYLEYLWSAIKLREIGENEFEKSYQFNNRKQVKEVFEKISNDLVNQEEAYLNGNLRDFFKRRSAQAKLKKPFVITTFNPETGESTSELDPDCVAFQKKYSV